MGKNDEMSSARFEMFKFYEDAAQRTKGHAWTQLTWILTISGALLAFSMKIYLEHDEHPAFLFIEAACALAGLLLCGYVLVVLNELGRHIRSYWTNANRLAAEHELLQSLVSTNDSAAAVKADYRAAYPRFIQRLRIPPCLFALGHVAWFAYVAIAR